MVTNPETKIAYRHFEPYDHTSLIRDAAGGFGVECSGQMNLYGIVPWIKAWHELCTYTTKICRIVLP